jgi:hypothetical protein
MPKVKPGESKEDYVSRAIPILKKEGLTDKQAQGKAFGMFETQTKKNEVTVYRHKKTIYRYADNAKTVKGFESPEPGDLPKEKADLLADVYAQYRKKGMSKEEAAKRAWGAVNKQNQEIDYKKFYDTIMQGGLSVGKEDFPEDQLRKGIEVEKEHIDVNSPYAEMIAEKISKDHLSELDDYYDKLAMIEGGK